MPGSMPLLFLLACWGSVTALRRRPPRSPRLTLIPLLAAAVPCVVLLGFGFLDDRFLGDFLPFFVLASFIGAVDIWRRLEGSRRRVRYVVLAGFVVLGSYGVVANTAVASTPTGWWSGAQGLRFARFQHAVSNLTGHPLAAHVVRGRALPPSAPIDELFIKNDCEGLYLYPTTGISNWLELESGPPYQAHAGRHVPRPERRVESGGIPGHGAQPNSVRTLHAARWPRKIPTRPPRTTCETVSPTIQCEPNQAVSA